MTAIICPALALVKVLSALAGSVMRTAVISGVPMPSSSSLQATKEQPMTTRQRSLNILILFMITLLFLVH